MYFLHFFSRFYFSDPKIGVLKMISGEKMIFTQAIFS